MNRLRSLLSWLAVFAALLAFFHAAKRSVLADDTHRMSDALPLYLYAGSVADGLDPLVPENLRAVYDARDMKIRAALWSTLYPTTTGVVLRPFAALSWEQFTRVWGWTLLLGAAMLGFFVPALRQREPWRDRLVRGVAITLMGLFPATIETARLGQVNMLLAALSAAALACVPRRRDLLSGVLLGLGAGLKLVPAALAGPLVLGKRWKVAVGGLLIGLPLMLLAFRVTPPQAFIEGVRATSAFQSSVSPAWLIREDLPAWAHRLGTARHAALLLLTLGAASAAVLARRGPGVLVGASMLVLAWLGTDASVFHLLYTPLYAPAWLWVCTWALDEGAPRWSWPVSALLAVLGVLLPDYRLWADDTTFSCMLLGWIVWTATLSRTAYEAAICEERGPLAALLSRFPAPSAALAGLGAAAVMLRVGLPTYAPLPVDELPNVKPGEPIVRKGPGFLDPSMEPPGGTGDDLPGHVEAPSVEGGAEKRWPMMAVSGSLGKGKRRPLDQHLSTAAGRWTELAEGPLAIDPRLSAWARALASEAPTAGFSGLSYQDLAVFLTREGVVLEQLGRRGVPIEPLRSEWSAAATP